MHPPNDIIALNFLPSATKQRQLRRQVSKESDGCLITGWNNPIECECAHIVPKSCGYIMNFKDVDTPNNCFILSNGMHAMFDNMEWTFDIYYLLDLLDNSTDNNTFRTKIISRGKSDRLPRKNIQKNIQKNIYLRKGIGTKRSLLNNYMNSEFEIPISKFPSFFLHYYVYHRYNYGLYNPDIKDIYSAVWKDLHDTYMDLKKCTDISSLRSYLLKLRSKGPCYPITCILKPLNGGYLILWDYFSYDNMSIENVERIQNTIAYDQYLQKCDPNYSPSPASR
jgi:hypothetical protein